MYRRVPTPPRARGKGPDHWFGHKAREFENGAYEAPDREEAAYGAPNRPNAAPVWQKASSSRTTTVRRGYYAN